MTLLQINFSCRSIINRCSKLSRYVYEIPNAFIGRISQAEPKKLASVVACVAAVSFPFPNARVRKSGKISSRGRGWGAYFSPSFWLTPGVLLRSPAFRSLVRSPRRLKKERNQLLRRLASVVKPKTCRALGIAVVGFVGDHLKDKKVTEFNTLDELLSEDLGILIPFPIQVIPPESVRSVC